MNDPAIIFYWSITLIVGVANAAFGIAAFLKKNKTGLLLGITAMFTFIATFSYLLSISNDVASNMGFALITATIYFISIDSLLLSLIAAVLSYTGFLGNKKFRIGFFSLASFAFVDAGMLLASAIGNNHFAVTLNSNPSFPTVPIYSMGPWFIVHLIYTYLLVASILVYFFVKIAKVPSTFKKQYHRPAVSIIVIVFLNAASLFIPSNWGAIAILDFSLPLYCFGMVSFYYTFFVYADKTVPDSFKNDIYMNIRQGIVLYDYKGDLIMSNEKAGEIFENIPKKVQDFSALLQFDNHDQVDEISVQRFIETGDGPVPMRIDYKKIKNSSKITEAYLFALENAGSDVDRVTSFAKLETLFSDEKSGLFKKRLPKFAVIFDINGLGAINSAKGMEEGDKLIASVANLIRKNFPSFNYMARGHEAHLLVVCRRMNLEDCQRRCKRVYEDSGKIVEYAIEPYDNDKTIHDNFTAAYRAMEAKKLLNHDAARSTMVTSMIKMLQECDPDTEAHVKRTRNAAAKLGKKLGLNDYNQARLELLTILHDIGKVGIPIEILNKPDKLTKEEFAVIKLHVEKGSHIAKTSKYLADIADEIRYHHERWDGKGYPDGIGKESIPYLSRIVSVVDSFDAMTNDRVYRKAKSIPEAIKELRDNAGTQFDPKVVSAFIELMEEENLFQPEPDDAEVVAPIEEVSVVPTIEQDKVFPVRYSHYHLDAENRVVKVDDNFEYFTGYTRDDIKNNAILQSDLVPEEDQFEYLTTLERQTAVSREYVFFEHRLKRKDGKIVFVYCLGKISYDPITLQKRSDIFITDLASSNFVSKMKEEEEKRIKVNIDKWEIKYRKDALTHLLSRGSFESDLEQRLLHEKQKTLLVIMDLNNFQEYNEALGHREGDALLKSIASIIKKSLRPDDLSCRLGGDEFGMTLTFEAGELNEVIMQRAQLLVDSINQEVLKIDKSGGMAQFRAGASVTTAGFTNYTKLFEDASSALYNLVPQDKSNIAFGKSFE